MVVKKSRKKKQPLKKSPLLSVKNVYDSLNARLPARNPDIPLMSENFARSWRLLKKHKGAFIRLTAIYAALYFLFVRSITAINLSEIRDIITLQWGNGEESFTTRSVLISELFGKSFNFDQTTGFYFLALFYIVSLAMIWLLRNFWAGKRTTVKEAFYQGMYPLIPMIIITIIMLVQLAPTAIAGGIVELVFAQGLAVSFIEKVVTIGVFAAGLLLSLYWLCGSIIAFYGVTVPGVTPMLALRTAKDVLRGRRFAIVQQLFKFILLTALIAFTIMLGILYVLPDTAIVSVTVLLIFLMPWIHFYLYGLYRDLIRE